MLIKFLLFTFAVYVLFFFISGHHGSRAQLMPIVGKETLFSLWNAAKSKYCELSKNGRADGVVTTWPIQIHLQRINLLTNDVAFCFDYCEQWRVNNRSKVISFT